MEAHLDFPDADGGAIVGAGPEAAGANPQSLGADAPIGAQLQGATHNLAHQLLKAGAPALEDPLEQGINAEAQGQAASHNEPAGQKCQGQETTCTASGSAGFRGFSCDAIRPFGHPPGTVTVRLGRNIKGPPRSTMGADPIFLQAGQWLGAAGGALVVVTVVAFLARWGVRFRLVGVSSFTLLLAISCLAFAVSYVPRISIPGARSVPVVYDNGTDLVIAAAPADLPAEAIRPTLEEVARNVHGTSRTSEDGFVHVRLRRVEPAPEGAGQPVVLGEALVELATGSVTLR